MAAGLVPVLCWVVTWLASSLAITLALAHWLKAQSAQDAD